MLIVSFLNLQISVFWSNEGNYRERKKKKRIGGRGGRKEGRREGGEKGRASQKETRETRGLGKLGKGGRDGEGSKNVAGVVTRLQTQKVSPHMSCLAGMKLPCKDRLYMICIKYLILNIKSFKITRINR